MWDIKKYIYIAQNNGCWKGWELRWAGKIEEKEWRNKTSGMLNIELQREMKRGNVRQTEGEQCNTQFYKPYFRFHKKKLFYVVLISSPYCFNIFLFSAVFQRVSVFTYAFFSLPYLNLSFFLPISDQISWCICRWW